MKYVIDLPHNTFRPYCNAKCIAIILEKGVPQQTSIKMAVAEEIGHDHNGKILYRWNFNNNRPSDTDVWDDIPLILQENKNFEHKYTFSIDSRTVFQKGILVPRYYWRNKIDEIRCFAEQNGMMLVSLQKLIDERVITFFDGHGSPSSEYKGKGDIPYVRVKDIVNWEIYKDPTSKITKEVYDDLATQSKEIKTYDIAYVRRGSYRIGSVAMVSPYDTYALYTREILFVRVLMEENKYNITPHYLLYLLSNRLVSEQTKNKVLIETTLPNIADRWKEIYLPVFKDKSKAEQVGKRIKNVIDKKWQAVGEVAILKDELGDFNT